MLNKLRMKATGGMPAAAHQAPVQTQALKQSLNISRRDVTRESELEFNSEKHR